MWNTPPPSVRTAVDVGYHTQYGCTSIIRSALLLYHLHTEYIHTGKYSSKEF